MTREERILIAGGYGEVGGRIAEELARSGHHRLRVAGRHPQGSAVRLDVRDPVSVDAALRGVGVVVSCVREPDALLLKAAIRAGVAYTSIAPPWLDAAELDALDGDARRSGARVVLASGLEPGISSVLARLGAERVGQVESVETALLLSVGDRYGPDSMSFLFEELRQPYRVWVGGREQPARAFARSKQVAFPEPIGLRRAYSMPFRDQHYYPRTLGAKSAVAFLALDPPWLGPLVAASLRAGLGRGIERARVRAAVLGLVRRLKHAQAGRDRFALAVEVRGNERLVRSTLTGREQARATALGASAVAEALAAREVSEAGVWLPEQVVPPAPFLERLRARGLAHETEER